MTFRSILPALLIAFGSAAAAGPVAEIGYAEVGELEGTELGLGYRLSHEIFHLTGVAGVLRYQGDDDRYSFDSGTTRCRDRSNGQFARTELCEDSEYAAFGRIEATVGTGTGIEGGIGYRFDDADEHLYGTASFGFGENTAIKVNYGEDYVNGGVVLRF